MEKKKLLPSKQQGQALMLYAATLSGVLMGFAASIINTNAISTGDYGDVRYVQNIIQLISCVLLFGYFQSGSRLLALSDSRRRSGELRGTLVLILAACSLLLMAAVGLMYFFHASSPQVARLFLFSLPVCFYPMLLNYLNTTAQGDGHIFLLSCARLLPALLYVPIAWFVYSAYGATASLMVWLQWGIYSVVLLAVVAAARPVFRNVGERFAELSVENKAYGLNLYWGSLAMVATNYLAGVTLGLFNEDNVDVGFYTLALTLTGPLAYLPAIVGTAYFKQFARQDRIPDKVFKCTLLLTVGSCVAFILLVRPFVHLLYPPEYAQVGTYASWMAVGFSFHGIGDMLNRYLGSHGQGRPILLSSVGCGLVKVTGYVALVYFFGITGALLTTILSSMVYCIMLWCYYRGYTAPKK